MVRGNTAIRGVGGSGGTKGGASAGSGGTPNGSSGTAFLGAAGAVGRAGVGLGGGLARPTSASVTLADTSITGNIASTEDNDVSGLALQ